MLNHLIIIGLTFLIFILIAKVSENKEGKVWIVAGVVVALIELGLVFGFLESLINKIIG